MLGLSEDRRSATRDSETCAMDFVHDQLATGRTLRVLAIIARSRASRPQSDLGSPSALLMLCRFPTGRRIGSLKALRVDQGNEFVSRDLKPSRLWAYQRGVTLDFSRPGKPTDNVFIEAFNSRFRAECLNAHWFLSLADAQGKDGGLTPAWGNRAKAPELLC